MADETNKKTAMGTPDTQDPQISFEEFKALCADAGIDDTSPQGLETDFRLGVALAEVTDELIRRADAGVLPTAGPAANVKSRGDLVRDAAETIQRIASLHDEGQN